MNKKLLTILASACLIIIIGFTFFKSSKVTSNKTANPSPTSTQKVSTSVKIAIDYGNDKLDNYSYDYSENLTAFNVLKKATDENKLKLEYKQYSFGVMVESINNVANSKDKAWIYFVNGKSANVGADKYQLKPGDTVEWKYITPSGE